MSDQDFDDLVQQTLKRMQEAAKTSVSSSYVVHRSNGEVVVRRSDIDTSTDRPAESPTKKTATG